MNAQMWHTSKSILTFVGATFILPTKYYSKIKIAFSGQFSAISEILVLHPIL